MPQDAILELKMRRRLYQLVMEYPGLHVRELARQLDTSASLVEYHLNHLLDRGLVSDMREDRYQRIYPTEGQAALLGDQERRTLGLLRERLPLSILLYLLDQDGAVAKHKDICAALGLGKSKLTFHLKKLQAAGVVEKTPDASFQVVRPELVSWLMVAYQPTPDMKQEFADLWLALYE